MLLFNQLLCGLFGMTENGKQVYVSRVGTFETFQKRGCFTSVAACSCFKQQYILLRRQVSGDGSNTKYRMTCRQPYIPQTSMYTIQTHIMYISTVVRSTSSKLASVANQATGTLLSNTGPCKCTLLVVYYSYFYIHYTYSYLCSSMQYHIVSYVVLLVVSQLSQLPSYIVYPMYHSTSMIPSLCCQLVYVVKAAAAAGQPARKVKHKQQEKRPRHIHTAIQQAG